MFSRQVLHGLLSQVHDGSFAVHYWDGTTETYGPGSPQFTLLLRDPAALDAIFAGPEKGFADAYIEGLLDVDGDLADVVALALRNHTSQSRWFANGVMKAVQNVYARRSTKRQKQDIASHYDLGNDFFQLYLDDSMTYSCAYFQDPSDTLEQAQRQKIDHSLKKLRLRPGESLLDIGCGWSALIMRAASQYGVKALGITLSEEQFAAGRDAIRRNGLEDCCEVRLVNYLDLVREGRTFDKIISIGMIEHVGKAHLGDFATATAAMLKDRGVAMLHHITTPWHEPSPTADSDAFIHRIFPGSYLPTLHEMLGHLGENGFNVVGVENLREHYRMTLDEWSRRFERNVDRVRAKFGEPFVRMWRLYLRGSSACFREGSCELHQTVVSKGVARDLPLTRDSLYALPRRDEAPRWEEDARERGARSETPVSA
jgi:cyclopropane-fatty-acyl-phospholipid synthase